MVPFVGLSEPSKLSVFSVDRCAFVDRPVERGRPVGRFRTRQPDDWHGIRGYHIV